MNRVVHFPLLLLLGLSILGAQDVVVEDEGFDLGLLSSGDPLVFGGTLSLEGGVITGYTQAPVLDDPAQYRVTSLGYALKAAGHVDARPHQDFRAYLGVTADLPGSGGLATPDVRISELFADYTLWQTVFFRVGKQSLSLGQGAVNLLPYGDALSLKAQFPVMGANTTLVFLARDAWMAGDHGAWEKAGVAGGLNGSAGPLSYGLHGFYQADTHGVVDASLVTVLAGVDTTLGASWYMPVSGARGYATTQARLFWEGLDPLLRLQTTWTWSGNHVSGLDHRIQVLGLLQGGLGTSGIKPGLTWDHAVVDTSGQVVVGLDMPVDALTSLRLGGAWVYGPVGSVWDRANADPEKRRYLVGLQLIVKSDF